MMVFYNVLNLLSPPKRDLRGGHHALRGCDLRSYSADTSFILLVSRFFYILFSDYCLLLTFSHRGYTERTEIHGVCRLLLTDLYFFFPL